MTQALLVLNAGSSSIKFALYDLELALHCRGEIEEIGGARMTTSGPLADALIALGSPPQVKDRDTINAWLVATLHQLPDIELRAAGHRIVHGGQKFSGPVAIDDASALGPSRAHSSRARSSAA